MWTRDGRHTRDAGGYRAGTILIAATLLACAAALAFRSPLRSRYWARQIIRAESPAQRAAPLTNLCNAGDAGRWGIGVLLAQPDVELRSYGVIALHHIHSDWSRGQLLRLLGDPDQAVRELAALGLAIHGDAAAIPELERLYRVGDPQSAAAACVALERMGSPASLSALAGLAGLPADALRRSALVESLAAAGTPECATALLQLLDDDRPCPGPTRAEAILKQFAPVARAAGIIGATDEAPASRPATQPAARTIAERAAAALSGISGLSPAFASTMSAREREAARQVWREWIVRARAGQRGADAHAESERAGAAPPRRPEP